MMTIPKLENIPFEEKIFVFDNIVPTSIQNLINIYSKEYTRFAYCPSTVPGEYGVIGKDEYESVQFVDMVLRREHGPNSNQLVDEKHKPYLNLILSPLLNALSHRKYLLDIEEVDRVKFNLQLKVDEKYKGKHNTPHIDSHPVMEGMWNGLYYVNDNDGNTNFFDLNGDIDINVFGDISQLEARKQYYEKFGELKIKKSVKAKKGRFVVFRGDVLHAGANPINNKERIVINYNYNFRSFQRKNNFL